MEPDHLQKLFASLSGALLLYARQWCKTPEDAVQEAFIDLARCAPEPASPKAWLYTTTRRKAQNFQRSESRHRNQLERWSQTEDGKITESVWLEPTTRNGIDATEVMDGLNLLEPSQRELIIAKVWGDLNFEELGELMTCSPSTAHRRYVTALSELKRTLTATNAPNNDAIVSREPS